MISAIGSNASLYNVCIALSLIVGIPKGRNCPLDFLINILFSGLCLYPLRFNVSIA